MATKEIDLPSVLRTASDLANSGCKFDENGKLADAMKAYDEAIMLMDGVLGEIPPSAEAWKVLLNLRSLYSNRLVIRQHDNISKRFDI
jgi:hypothetical protein